jgi:hypothetical protein
MNIVDQALETQLKNIQAKTGKTLDELFAFIGKSGLTRHGEILAMLKRDLGMGHGDANRLALIYLQTRAAPAAEASVAAGAIDAEAGSVENELYGGAKAGLWPIHQALMAAIGELGPFEIAPKKGYLSLRRKKQFAMVGPAAKMRVELGLNMKGITATERLIQLPPGGMCQYKVYVATTDEVDRELIAWIRRAYEGAG